MADDDLTPSRASEELARRCKNERGYQKSLASRTGISQSWLSRLAIGQPIHKLAHAQKLRDEAGIPLEWWSLPPLREPGDSGEAA